MSAARVLFVEPIRFKAEPGLNRAVARAARQARTSAASWLREAVRDKLKADGVDLPALPDLAPDHREAA